MNQQVWQNTLRTLLARSANDDTFRAKCLIDPVGAIKEIGGVELPADAKVRFVERLEETLFVLPPRRGAAGELNEEELENVAGGIVMIPGCAPNNDQYTVAY